MFTFFIGLLGKYKPTDTLQFTEVSTLNSNYPEFKKFLYSVFEPLICSGH